MKKILSYIWLFIQGFVVGAVILILYLWIAQSIFHEELVFYGVFGDHVFRSAFFILVAPFLLFIFIAGILYYFYRRVILTLGVIIVLILFYYLGTHSASYDTYEARIKGNLASVMVQAALYYDNNNNSYGIASPASEITCIDKSSLFGSPDMQSVIRTLIDEYNVKPTCAVGVSGNSWAVNVPLPSARESLFIALQRRLMNKKQKSRYWCVDDTGIAESIDHPISEAKCGPPVKP